MITSTLFRDTFEYFAKFPVHDGVMKSFNSVSSSLFAEEYPAFKSRIEDLAEHSIIPGISGYIFGVDRELVLKRVKELDGFYLFVDYGSLSSEKDAYQVKTDDLLIGLSVAVPLDPKSIDNIEALLLAEKAFDFIRQIRVRMIADQRDSPFLQHLTFPNEITPFSAPELENSTGFTMLFSKKYTDLFGGS